MEPLAHTLIGATLGHLATRRAGGESAERGLLVAGIVAANVPDVDVLAYALGSDFALGFRRGITHGVIAMAFWPLLLTPLLGWWRGRGRPLPGTGSVSARLVGVVALACWSHPLLDWLNNYGIRLLIPFDQRWFYGDVAFIVDPWMWLVLGGGIVLARAPGARERRRWLVLALICAAAVAASPTPVWARAVWLLALLAVALLARSDRLAPSRAPAAVALAAFLLYVALLAGAARDSRHRVARIAEVDATHEGIPGRRLMVGPVLLDPLRRQVVLRVRDGYRIGAYRLGSGAIDWRDPLPAGDRDPAAAAAWEDRRVAGFARWVRFPYHRIVEEPEGRFVYLLDARYATAPTTSFGGARVRAEPVD